MKCVLIFELEAFFRTKNYKRIVLSTSEMQVVAKKMYHTLKISISKRKGSMIGTA